MQVTITGRHIDLDHSIKKYIADKLSKLKKYTSKIVEIKVILDIEGYRHIVELIIAMKGKNMTVEEEGRGLKEAFDISLDKMEKRLRRYWGKKKDHPKK